ncbi:alpha/beta hydrolase [Pseudomonas promysalinigenes]|uniref:alpha/beta hydrolase n=1 Tax=Pseudomonas promysalinigenes TaxID=485898 RepID=UPI0027276B71
MNSSAKVTAEQIRAVGNDFPNTHALYEPMLAQQVQAGVLVHRDVSYGPEPIRHTLDVYQPETDPPAAGWPVLVFLHGGGFIRGSKEHRQNIGYFLAQRGYIAVLANYRLAPDSKWPSGPEDVVRIVQWANQEIAHYQGDAANIVLMGESAGAAHVAAATLISEFHPSDWSIKGAILLSGPYNARLEGRAHAQLNISVPDFRNEAYLGTAIETWGEAAIVDHISAKPLPLLIGYAEWDLLQMQIQASELFARLVCQHDFSPELQIWSGHNHYSQGYSFATADESISAKVMTFLAKCTAPG